MATTGVRVDALLRIAGIDTDAEAEALAADMNEIHRTDARAAVAWRHGKPLDTTHQLRALLGVLPVPRRAVFNHIAPVQLLPALWCVRLGDHLHRVRTEAGLNREAAAKLAGINPGTINRWEHATTVPATNQLVRYLEALDLDAATLLALGDWPPADVPLGFRGVFGTWLYQGMARLQIGETRLAHKLRVSQPMINAWSRGRGMPGRASWERLATRFTDAGMPITVDQLRMMQIPERAPQHVRETYTATGRLLHDARVAALMCYEVAAEISGVTDATIRRYERAATGHEPAVLNKLRLAYRIDRDDLEDALAEDRGITRRDIGASMKLARLALGMRNADLAKALGVHRNAVHRWEQGYVEFPRELYADLGRVLQVPVSTIEEWSYEPDPERIAAGKRAQARRLGLGLTQDAVAARLGVTQPAVSAMEVGGAPLSPGYLRLLAA